MGALRAAKPPTKYRDAFGKLLDELEQATGHQLDANQLIPEDMTFRQWCEKLGREGLKVDGKPFTLDNRPAMAWVYDRIPSTRKEAFRKVLVIMKCAQVGFTVMEMLAALYLGIKFGPSIVGMFLPDLNLAQGKSTERFMPVVRSIPDVHKSMTQEADDGSGRKGGEGNVMRRRIDKALYFFAWTSGRSTTESFPMDVLSFDEVQEMTLEQMEKTMERLSASELRYVVMGSTANWPDADIHHWYKRGKQFKFHTRCPTCNESKPLDDYFPECIRWDSQAIDDLTGQPGAYRYVCPNGHWLDDPQAGEWVAAIPDVWIDSVHFPQMLSPTISPGEIMQKFLTSTDKKNFYNRVLGKPYLDPSQIPVTLEHMANCVESGKRMGVKWKTLARGGTYMGIDQMGNFNVVIIKERLDDGRQAVVHVEEIYSDDPFARCSELMESFNIFACVVEINPNYNDAKRFANRHRGKVFICNSFGSLPDDMIKWGDAPKLDVSERRTDEDERDRYTVRIDQFKCMQTSMARFTAPNPLCVWPDPQALTQDVLEKGVKQHAAVAPRAFNHFTKTALVVERDDETNQHKRVVKKVGIDPHFSYANLLCDVAWARAHGTTTFIMPDTERGQATSEAAKMEARQVLEAKLTALPAPVQAMLEGLPEEDVCGSCISFDPERSRCEEREMRVRATSPGCPIFIRKS